MLTKKGLDLFNEIFVKHARYVTDLIYSALSEEEISKLSALLRKLGLSLKARV